MGIAKLTSIPWQSPKQGPESVLSMQRRSLQPEKVLPSRQGRVLCSTTSFLSVRRIGAETQVHLPQVPRQNQQKGQFLSSLRWQSYIMSEKSIEQLLHPGIRTSEGVDLSACAAKAKTRLLAPHPPHRTLALRLPQVSRVRWGPFGSCLLPSWSRIGDGQVQCHIPGSRKTPRRMGSSCRPA